MQNPDFTQIFIGIVPLEQAGAKCQDGAWRGEGSGRALLSMALDVRELWPQLLADMRSHCENAMSYYGSRQSGEPRKQDDAVDLLTSLFTIDARSDKGLLDGCSVEQLRDIYEECVGGVPLNPTLGSYGFFYVDAEAFQSLSQRVPYVKMGDPHYDPEEHKIDNHPRFPQGQDHWGWFRAEVSDVLDAFESLDCLAFDEMAPPMLRNPDFLTLYGQFTNVPNTNNLEI